MHSSSRKKQPDIGIETLFEFFKELNTAPDENSSVEQLDLNHDLIFYQNNDYINCPFTRAEIFDCEKILKNEKACGEDGIINEYIKCTIHRFINIYEKLFNIIFDKGIVPNSWLVGIVKPIYKNKGNKFDPQNYRPITIVSCLGRLFTAVLNNRLNDFSETFCIIQEQPNWF